MSDRVGEPVPGRESAAELIAGYRRGALSPVDATEAALAAIERHDPAVNAYVLVDPDGARAAAAASEARWREGTPLGPADGVPTAIKDILWTRGWPTLRGSNLIDPDQEWPEDAPVTARLRESGAVILGKTSTPEFAWKGVTDSPRHGVTGNPWDPGLTPGGSSGGSATAVGLGMATWSVGTDGGGSVRIPASFTGTVALKPTYGVVPLYPASPFGTLAHGGPVTRSVRDAALMLDLISRFDDRDWSALPSPTGSFLEGLEDGVEGLRVAYSPTLGFGHNDLEVEALVRAGVGVLADAGAVVEEVDPGFKDPVADFEVLWFSGAAKVLEKYGDAALDRIDPALREAVEQGRRVSGSRYLDAMAVRMELGRLMGAFHRTYDLLVTPTMPITAFAAGREAPEGWRQVWTSWTPYTYPFNMTQQPGLSVPCGLTAAGLPVGLQVVGPRHADALVLRAGHAYEQRTGWARAVPPMLTETAEVPTGEETR